MNDFLLRITYFIQEDFITPSERFLRRLLTDSLIQQAVTSINFEHLQNVAATYAYTISEIEMNTVLAQNPDLVIVLQALISASDLEFELDEAEMSLIAGGAFIDPSSRQSTKD